MNKTVTINISGIIFHIEEDAFEKLSKYLSTIKGYFSKTDGGNEIMGDIEARIAEMLQSKTSAVKQVVLMADVDSVIETMGKPEEFAGDSQTNSQPEEEDNSAEYATGEPVKKRMFRDPDNKTIGGVCSGIAAYFDVDVVWVRLAMFLLIFFGGVSLWVYIVLWIVIPEAKTTAEKLAMRGEKIDINNISRTVKEEAEQLKKRMQKYGNDIKNGDYSQPRNFFDKLADFLKDFFILFGKVFGRLVGLVLLVFGVVFLIGFIAAIFGIMVPGAKSEPHELLELIFTGRPYYSLGIFGAILLFCVPILMMFYGGIKLLFRIKYSNRWLNLSSGLLWLLGIILVVFVSVRTASDFAENGRVKNTVNIAQKDTLYLKVSDFKKSVPEMSDNEEEYTHYNRHGHRYIRINHHRDYVIANVGNTPMIGGYASLRIVQSNDDKFNLYVSKTAQGPERRFAMEQARNIEYKVTQTDSLLSFDDIFMAPFSEKFWAQDVELVLEVPVGKVIYLDKNISHFIHNVDNITNTYDGDMVGRRWIMTKKGLECIDCEGLEKDTDHDDFDGLPEPPQPPNPPTDLNVNVEDANVKIDKEGNIKVKSKNTEVEIGKNGIHVDKKDKDNKEK